MLKHNKVVAIFFFLSILVLSNCIQGQNRESRYDDLVQLFNSVRELPEAELNSGVPDYTAAAMEKQDRGLKQFQKRLAAMEIGHWPLSQKVDYHLVRAEMNALEFHHKVFKPWARDPGFYSIRSGDAGSSIRAESFLRPLFDNFRMEAPLSKEQHEKVGATLKAIPKL